MTDDPKRVRGILKIHGFLRMNQVCGQDRFFTPWVNDCGDDYGLRAPPMNSIIFRDRRRYRDHPLVGSRSSVDLKRVHIEGLFLLRMHTGCRRNGKADYKKSSMYAVFH